MALVKLLVLQWLDWGKQGTLLFPHTFTLFLLFIFSLFILVKLINGSWAVKENLPPSPPKLPIVGNLFQLGNPVHSSLRDLSKQHGPLMLLHLGSRPTLVVSSVEMAREIMKTHDLAFANRPSTVAGDVFSYGGLDIGFIPYGHYLRQVKKICVTELLSGKRVQSFSFVRIEETANMIEKISRSSLVGAPINLSEMVISLSNDIVSRCALGGKYDEDGKSKFGELCKEIVHLMGAFSFGDTFPMLGWMDILTGLVPRIKTAFREIDTFFDQVIDEHIMKAKHGDSGDTSDFVDLLLRIEENNIFNIKFTRDNVKAILLDMCVAGTDATSTSIEWGMAELVKNPNTMKKAQEEVRRVIGDKQRVDEEDIHQLDYLKFVVKESLRLHPPLPLMVPRECTATTNVKGYHIPAKTKVLVNAWAIQRDSKVCDNAEEFIPERFTNTPSDFKGQDYEYIPFGLGRRACPGMSFGAAVAEFAIANLLYWFDWELPGGAKKEELDMSETFGSSVSKKIPLHLLPVSHAF